MSAPRLGFVVGGAQKAGTTALASYLAAHPGVALPRDKEAHVFDAPDFDEGWTPADIDARYAGHFDPGDAGRLHGDATPIYLLHPAFVRRIVAYNPAMKWIVLLRHPVERALSQYHMERARGDERWPFWAAMLFERWRLRGHGDDFAHGSPLRHHSYRLRGDYARQLAALHAHFPPAQVLVLRSGELAADPAATVARVLDFLGLPPMPAGAAYPRVFEGSYPRLSRGSLRWRLWCWMMRREIRAGLHLPPRAG